VPGVKGAYYEDNRSGCSVEDCIILLKLKGTSKKLCHNMDQVEGTGTCYSLSLIDMYDMEAREPIHNLAAYLAHHHGSWVYKHFAAEYVEFAQTCYWHDESQSMRSKKNKCGILLRLVEFQVQIENMENMENMDAAPQGAAAQNLVGSVDSMSFKDRHASAVSNNPRSMDASTTPTLLLVACFPMPPPHMNPKSQTPVRSNVYHLVSSQPTVPPIKSDMYIAASTSMETFQSDIDDVKEDCKISRPL
jgi:hypothetical protein